MAEIYLLWISEAIWQTSNANYVHIKDVYQSENNGTVIVTGVTNVARTGLDTSNVQKIKYDKGDPFYLKQSKYFPEKPTRGSSECRQSR